MSYKSATRFAVTALALVVSLGWAGRAKADDNETPWADKYLVCGPFPNDGGGPGSGLDAKYGPEKETPINPDATYDGIGGKVGWTMAMAGDGVLNFVPLFETKENACAYAWCKIKAPKDMGCELQVSSDDGIKIWVNGAQVHSNGVDRGLNKDELDKVKIKLKAGDNDLLMKITQGGGDWSACAKIVKTDTAVGEVKFDLPIDPSKLLTPFITKWKGVGSFANDDNAGFDKEYGPEKELKLDATYDGVGGKVKWTDLKAGDNGVVNFLDAFDPKENVCAYAYAIVKAPKETACNLLLGSDDRVKVWINGKLVHSNPADRGVVVDNDNVPVKLAEGDNKLLVKVTQGGGDWGLCVRFSKGKDSVAGVTFDVPK